MTDLATNTPILFPPLLLATDGSPNAQFAQQLLYLIAQMLQAQPDWQPIEGQSIMTVLRVQPRRSSQGNGLRQRRLFSSTKSRQDKQATEPASDPALKITTQHGSVASDTSATLWTDMPTEFAIDCQIRQGRPAIEILSCARTMQAGLIAVGSRGTGGVRKLLLGSVSAAVARYAHCSVLIARSGSASPSVSFEHVLLVVGDPQATQRAIATTRQLIPAGIQRVTILYAQPLVNAEYLFGPFVTPTPSWQLSQSLQAAQKEQSEQLLQQAKNTLNLPNMDVQTILHVGEPGPLICQIAHQHQINLIILGSHTTRQWLKKHQERRQEPRSARLNTTEDYMIHHAPCPVLLCRG